MQDFIKQSSAHKRHQCCAILDHINIFQSRIIFQQRDKAQKNMISGYQHKILKHPRKGVGVCLSTRASQGLRARQDFGNISVESWAQISVAICACVLCSGRGVWHGFSQCKAGCFCHWNHWRDTMGVFSLAESSKGDTSSTWINK